LILRILAVLLALGLLAGGAGILTLRSSLAPVGGSEERVFRVPVGAGLGKVANSLERAGLVRRALAFEALARWRGQETELRAGEYLLSPALSAEEILQRITSGQVRTHELVLPEGLRALEIADRVAQSGLAERDAFLGVVLDPNAPARFGVEGRDLEGYLFPETYQLAMGLPAEEVVAALLEQFHRVWAEIEPAARSRGMSMSEVVTLASIVEKETGAPEERPLIAAVFHNRLKRGMRLETDPTVIYGIPDFDGNLTRAHLEDAGNPYNTYQIPALPPGPIANPGAAALRAVVAPAESDYLFFVSRNDGSHVFSRSYREHVNAVNRFQRSGRRSR